MKSWIKAVLFLVCFGVLGAVVASVLWFKVHVFEKEAIAHVELEEIRATDVSPHDFSPRLFSEAVVALTDGDETMAREKLVEVLRFHREGTRGEVALQLLGELNMDQLMTADATLGKKSVEVARGQSVNAIAKAEKCTFHYIVRVNGLTKVSALQPHDRLWVCPLDFKVVVRIGSDRLYLMREGKFFKAYDLLAVRRPPGIRLPARTKVSDKKSMLNGRQVLLSSDQYHAAAKSIDFGKLLSVRSVVEGGEVPDRSFGIFMRERDVDELMTVLRVGNVVEINP